MRYAKIAFKQTTVFVMSLVLLGVYPGAALADTSGTTPPPTTTTTTTPPQTPPTDTSATTTTPPVTDPPAPSGPTTSTLATTTPPVTDPPSSSGPSKPNGPDANTYHFNKDTGLWENDHYTWDPVTKQTKPKDPQTYSYNPVTGLWDTTNWRFDAPSGKYVPNVASVNTPPIGAALILPAVITNTGPNSVVNNTANNTNTGVFNGFYNASISNNLSSVAQTGDATVAFNTLGGNATSGNALAMANLVNMLQSTAASLQGGNLKTFIANINGTVNGDITIDPSKIGPGSNVTQSTTTNNNLTLNDKANGTITNNINLAAASGNAGVIKNTTGGNATSGSANAIADIVNVINSIIGAGKSFMGVININGNLNGDILLPPGVLNSLIAASGPSTTIDTSNITNNKLLANLTSNQTVANNIKANSGTGNALVSGNTTAGNATSGNASNKLTVLNLTGRQVIGKDALLVFVNVLGNWVGMIMNAPGANSAALGGNVTTNNLTNNSATLNSTSNQAITNNLILGAHSGDASVSGNTKAGNATSGNASTSANIANIANSSLNLSDWLGILFINVFGTWNGSFGINTPAGDPPAGGLGGGLAGAVKDVKVFGFIPIGGNVNLTQLSRDVLSAVAGGSAQNSNPAPLTTAAARHNTPRGATGTRAPASINAFSLLLAGLGLLGFGLLFATTRSAKKAWVWRKTVTKPVGQALHAAGTRLLTFLF